MKQLALCWYCFLNGVRRDASFVVHDKRKCVYVCDEHARFRETTSKLGGHKGCPEGHPDGPGPIQDKATRVPKTGA